MTDTAADSILATVRARVEAADVFGAIELEGHALRCAARDSAEEAWYRLRRDAEGWQVELVTADRWLSESIEADLMHYGDPIEELVEEELVELGEGSGDSLPTIRHYRSDDLLYTFRTPLGADVDPERAARYLLAYEAAFRELGDMQSSDEE